jgi:hypothetical protein
VKTLALVSAPCLRCYAVRGVLTLEMSVSEFAEVQILSDDARRARFNLPTSCAPGFTALKRVAADSSGRIVLIDCRSGDGTPDQPQAARWAPKTRKRRRSWR